MKELKIVAASSHRNGVGGAPFGVVLFEDCGEEGSRKVGIVFAEDGHCAVLDVAKLAAGDIAFMSNSWRGDLYEPALRGVIRQIDQEEDWRPVFGPDYWQPHQAYQVGQEKRVEVQVGTTESIEDVLLAVARQHLGIVTLETQHSDSLDFHEVSVWGLKEALSAAYQAGAHKRDRGEQGPVKHEGKEPGKAAFAGHTNAAGPVAKDASQSEDLCYLDMGRFRAVLTEHFNEEAAVSNCKVEILCDGKQIFAPLMKHELAGVRRIVQDKGREWLTGTLVVKGVGEAVASTQDVKDFDDALESSEALVGRFIEHGWRKVLHELAEVAAKTAVSAEQQKVPRLNEQPREQQQTEGERKEQGQSTGDFQKLAEAAKLAVQEKGPHRLWDVVDHLRLGHGFDHDRCYDFVHEHSGSDDYHYIGMLNKGDKLEKWLAEEEREALTARRNHTVYAWCSRPFRGGIEVEAESPEEAIALAQEREDELNGSAEDCCPKDFLWREFAVENEAGEELLRVVVGDAQARLHERAQQPRHEDEAQDVAPDPTGPEAGEAASTAAVASERPIEPEAGSPSQEGGPPGNEQKWALKRQRGSLRAWVYDSGADREATFTVARVFRHESGEWRYSPSVRERDLGDLGQILRDVARGFEQLRGQQQGDQHPGKEKRDRGRDQERKR
jgi:hypothetical protein